MRSAAWITFATSAGSEPSTLALLLLRFRIAKLLTFGVGLTPWNVLAPRAAAAAAGIASIEVFVLHMRAPYRATMVAPEAHEQLIASSARWRSLTCATNVLHVFAFTKKLAERNDS